MVELTPGSNIDLGEAALAARSDPLILLRAGAVNTYANLEQSLFRLFAALLDAPPEKATIVFYRIVNTKSRNTIISKLMRQHFGDEFSVFWNSVVKLIRQLDDQRNKIIHWHIVNNINSTEDGRNISELTLDPPESIYGDDAQEPLRAKDLEAFIHKADFVARLLNMFVHSRAHKERLGPPWPDIFQRAATYPPDQDHPLNH